MSRTAATRRFLAAAPIIALLLAVAAILSSPATAGVDAPLEPPRTVRLEEMWRVGGEGGHLFGLMIAADCDADGNVYLLDQQLCEVTVVAPDGTILRVIGRQGEGPGEVRTPQGLAIVDGDDNGDGSDDGSGDGSGEDAGKSDRKVLLAEQFPGKFVALTATGEPAGTIKVSGGPDPGVGFTFIAGCERRGGNLVIAGQYSVPIENGQNRVSYLAAIAADGTETVRYVEHRTTLDFQKAHFLEREMAPAFHIASAVGPDGCVYSPPSRDAYLIEVRGPEGTLERSIGRPFLSRERDERELRRWEALFETQARQLPFPITWEVEEREPAISELRVAADGTLWVRHSRSDRENPAGVFMRYDNFDEQGRWLREVHVRAEADPTQDGLILLADDRVLLVKGLVLARLTATGSQGAVFGEEDETGSMEVICCRMVE